MIGFGRNTQYWTKWWADRKIDWKVSYTDTWNHPHRTLISWVLGKFPWVSLLEVGCGSGANIINIIKHHKGKQVGGIDVNPDAIKLAKETFEGAYLKVGSVEDIPMSDKSTDIILSDMTLIYIGPRRIDGALKELRRVARDRVVLCEFHVKSPWQRFKIWRESGYHAHNYQKLLEKHGFYDIILYKLPKEAWPGGYQEKHGYIITAKVPKHY